MINKISVSKSIGYWASQEQYSMQDLLRFVISAEKGGFKTCLTSDHFHPWYHDGGYSNFTWIWMAIAAERTKNMHFISGVTAPVYRYHPGIIAQAFASLDTMYPGRIGLGIGTGEALNEVPLGFNWPSYQERIDRTVDAIEIIQGLWKKSLYDFVTYEGNYFKTLKAKLYTPPKSAIPLYMAASGNMAAKIAGWYTDGIITNIKASESYEILNTFNQAALTKDKKLDSLNKIAKPKISYANDYDKAFKSAQFWRVSALDGAFNLNLSNPQELQRKAEEEVSDQKLKDAILIITTIEDCIKLIEDLYDVGYTSVYVHSTSPDEMRYIQDFSKTVLPYFNDKKVT